MLAGVGKSDGAVGNARFRCWADIRNMENRGVHKPALP